VAATLQLSVLKLRQIWRHTLEDDTLRMRVECPMNHQSRDFNRCECRRINAFRLQAHHVVPRFIMRSCVNLVFFVRRRQYIVRIDGIVASALVFKRSSSSS
jgi:hypothetical protein